jgi:hypothetical protein
MTKLKIFSCLFTPLFLIVFGMNVLSENNFVQAQVIEADLPENIQDITDEDIDEDLNVIFSDLFIDHVSIGFTSYESGDSIEGYVTLRNDGNTPLNDYKFNISLASDFDEFGLNPTEIFNPSDFYNFSLKPKETRKIDFSYKLPKGVGGEQFSLWINAYTMSDLLMGVNLSTFFEIKGGVEIIKTDFVGLILENDINFDKWLHPESGPVIYKDQDPKQVFFMSILKLDSGPRVSFLENESFQAVTLTPKLEVYDFIDDNKKILEQDLESFEIKPDETIRKIFEAPLFDYKPSVYVAKLTYYDQDGNQRTSTLTYRYVTAGSLLSIDSITLKNTPPVLKKDIAEISVYYEAGVDDFLASEFGRESGSTIDEKKIILVEIFDEKDRLVGSDQREFNVSNTGTEDFQIKVNRNIGSMNVKVTVFDLDNNIVDEQMTSLYTDAQVPKNNIILYIIFGLIIFIALFFLIKKNKNNDYLLKNTVGIFVILICYFSFPGSVNAQSITISGVPREIKENTNFVATYSVSASVCKNNNGDALGYISNENSDAIRTGNFGLTSWHRFWKEDNGNKDTASYSNTNSILYNSGNATRPGLTSQMINLTNDGSPAGTGVIKHRMGVNDQYLLGKKYGSVDGVGGKKISEKQCKRRTNGTYYDCKEVTKSIQYLYATSYYIITPNPAEQPSCGNANNNTYNNLNEVSSAGYCGDGSTLVSGSQASNNSGFSWKCTRGGFINSCNAYMPLSASCSVSPTSAITNQYVTWTANPVGGSGPYDYFWQGDVSGSSKFISKSYDSPGTKNAQVTVYSGEDQVTANCSVEVAQAPFICNVDRRIALTNSGSIKYSPLSNNSNFNINDFYFNFIIDWKYNSGQSGTINSQWISPPGNVTINSFSVPGSAETRFRYRLGQSGPISEVPIYCPGVYFYDSLDDIDPESETINASCTIQTVGGSFAKINKGQGLTFIGNSNDGIGNLIYKWFIGNSNSGNNKNFSKSFPDLGIFDIRLEIVDGIDREGSNSCTVLVCDGDNCPSLEIGNLQSVTSPPIVNVGNSCEITVYAPNADRCIIDGSLMTVIQEGQSFGAEFTSLAGTKTYNITCAKDEIRDPETNNVLVEGEEKTTTATCQVNPAPAQF